MKKSLLKSVLAFLFVASSSVQAFAQCANSNTLVAGNLTPPGVSLSTTQTYGSGQYVLANVVAGASYTISTCGSSAFDSQLTVYNDLTGAYIAYNDDFCGLQSTVNFTPTFCGNVRVLLNQYFCTTGTSSMDVTMTMNSAGTGIPTLTSTPDLTACNGGTVTVGTPNNGSGGLAPYSYAWTPPTNLATPTMSTSTATVTATQNYTLTLTDANGCSDTDQVLVTMLPAPTVNLGVDTTYCGGPVLLDAANAGSAYLWSTGAGSQTISVTVGGTYSVAVQDLNGCIGSDAVVIAINPNPTVSLGNDTTSCSNSVTLDGGSGYTGYAWSTGDNTQTAIVSSSGPVTVTVTDGNGCMATDTAIVTLSPAPVVNLGPDTVQCGGSVVLDAANPGSLYFWSNSTSAQTTSVTASGTYSVTVITPAGCSNVDSINVTINNQPVVNLGPDTSICGNSILLDAGNPGSTYAWSNAANTQTTSAGSGTISVVVTDPSGCADADTIIVTTNAAPTVSAGPDVTVCAGGNTTLVGTGGLVYDWSTGATTTSIIVSPSISTVYYVTGYDVNGCSASASVYVTVAPLANALFTSSVVGATANFNNLSSNAVSYSWNFGDASPANNTANPSHTYSANGTYTVTLTVTSPCGTDTYTMTVTISQVGIQDNDLAQTLSLYPNPNDGNFTLTFDFEKAKDVTIQVLDISGRIVYDDQQSNIISYNKQIGIESAQSGMYFVRIITNDGVVTEKVTVQR